MLTDFRMPEISASFPNTWNYDKALGMSSKDIGKCWDFINDPETRFWQNLPCLDGAFEFLNALADLPDHVDLYFVTARSGATAKAQTERWLDANGLGVRWNPPTVLISKEKGEVAHALDLHLYIDDKDENCVDVRVKSPSTKCYQLNQPWNHAQTNIIMIDTLSQFLNVVKESL